VKAILKVKKQVELPDSFVPCKQRDYEVDFYGNPFSAQRAYELQEEFVWEADFSSEYWPGQELGDEMKTMHAGTKSNDWEDDEELRLNTQPHSGPTSMVILLD